MVISYRYKSDHFALLPKAPQGSHVTWNESPHSWPWPWGLAQRASLPTEANFPPGFIALLQSTYISFLVGAHASAPPTSHLFFPLSGVSFSCSVHGSMPSSQDCQSCLLLLPCLHPPFTFQSLGAREPAFPSQMALSNRNDSACV